MSKHSSTRPKQGQSANKPTTNGTTKSAQAQTNGKTTANEVTKTSESELVSKASTTETAKATTTASLKQAQPKDAPVSQPLSKATRIPEKRSDKLPVKQAFSANRPLTKQAMKYERRQAEQQRRVQEKQRATRNKRIGIISAVVALLVVGSLVVYFVRNPIGNSTTSTQPVVEGTVVNANYPPVDGAYCDALEQTAYHIHAHLSMWVNGQPYQLPQGVGIAPDNSCLYWMHVHDTTGVIHIEAPQNVSFTLGNFFDVWDQSFHSSNYPTQLSSTTGWTVYVNGKPYTGDFHSIPLTAHTLISMMYASPNAKPDTTYNWGSL